MLRWPAPLRTEAIVLRSIRYGEADRILHLYTPDHGRLGAIAKGARRARSRFGARLEPFFHVRAVLHEGRGELLTVTGVDTIAAHARPARARRHARRRRAGLRRRVAAVRDRRAASRGVPAAGQRARRCSSPTPRTHGPATGWPSASSCCWPRASCPSSPPARCAGRPSTSAGSRPPPAASSAARARRPRSRSTRRPTGSWSARSGRPLAEAPDGSELALRQVERAIGETAEHHAHVRLRPLLAA